ncbi:N-acetylmannosamine-6-phosphate 2-epimerase [Paenibacillus sp. 32O-W]|nr:N-acetylmannosamine-6-phosphate 2-epimerase [Paenibacillus sp. 32O-W]
MNSMLEQLRNGLVVSCQALEHEPLHGAHIMARMARAAEEGGAVGIRANGAEDVAAIKQVTGLPVIGLVKQNYADSEVFITPTWKEVEQLITAGADIVALDATRRRRPNGETLESLITAMKEQGQPIMADVSTMEEAEYAESLGVDCVSTTLSGYTSYSPQKAGPDYELVKRAVKQLSIPVIAEGRIWSPKEAVKMLELGAYAVVVGTAITRPQEITKRYVAELSVFRLAKEKV